jgi:hypothetical protein
MDMITTLKELKIRNREEFFGRLERKGREAVRQEIETGGFNDPGRLQLAKWWLDSKDREDAEQAEERRILQGEQTLQQTAENLRLTQEALRIARDESKIHLENLRIAEESNSLAKENIKETRHTKLIALLTALAAVASVLITLFK